MTRRRAGVARRAVDPWLFLVSDGWSYSLLTGERLLASESAAAAAWERCRPVTWALWAARATSMAGPFPCPPDGARAFDGLAGIEAGVDEALGALAAHRSQTVDAGVLDALDVFADHLRWAARDALRGVETEK